jgi:P-type Cu+ transporter
VLLTGDNAATAHAAAAAAGIDEVISEALPAAKAQVIAELEGAGRSVAMVATGSTTDPPWPRLSPGWRWVRAPTSPSAPRT